MSETPTSGLAVLVSDLAAIVANSSTFQALGGFADATEAADAVYMGSVPIDEENDLPRPHAVVYVKGDKAAQSIATGGAALTFTTKATGFIAIEALVPSDPLTKDYRDAPSDAYIWFLNQIDGIIQDIQTCALSVHSQIIRGASLMGEVERSMPPAVDYLRGVIAVQVGIGR